MWQADATGSQTPLRRMLNDSAEDVWIFLPLPAARQLRTLLVITVSGVFFCLFAYALPSSFVRGNKNIPNSLENFLCSDLKRLNSVPREICGSWIKLCGKILYSYRAAAVAGAEFPFTDWLIYPFVVAMYQNPLNFFPFFSELLQQKRPRLSAPSPASSEPQGFSFPRIHPAPKSCLCQSMRFAIFLTLFSHTPSLDYAYTYILPPEYLACPNHGSG